MFLRQAFRESVVRGSFEPRALSLRLVACVAGLFAQSCTAAPQRGDVAQRIEIAPGLGLTLVNAATDSDIEPLIDGSLVILDETGSELSVRADVDMSQDESVVFTVNGVDVRTESAQPYAIAGDRKGDYFKWDVAVGVYNLGATVYSEDHGGGTVLTHGQISIEVVQSAPIIEKGEDPQDIELTLVDAETDQDLGLLADGAQIDLATVGNALTVRADTFLSAHDSAVFVLDGLVYQIENHVPYAMAGDSAGDLKAWDLVEGDHALRVDLYDGSDGSGVLLGTVSRSFSLLNGDETAGGDMTPGEIAVSAYPVLTRDALGRPSNQITTLIGTTDSQVRVGDPGHDHTFDLRTWDSTAYPFSSHYPLVIGKGNPGHRTVVVGGKVVGQQSRDLTWRQMKSTYDGAGLLIHASHEGDWMVVDGMRLENQMDDLRPRTAARFVFRNIWSRYTRDDSVENDDVKGGLVHDCLFESTFMFLSEQNGTWDGKHDLEISHVLARLEPMPYDVDIGGDAPASKSLIDGKAHGQLFKHFGDSDTPLYVHDSLFYVPQMSSNGPNSMGFPANATYEDVVLIWTGGGSYPGKLPASGVQELNLNTHTRGELDKAWDDAVAKWKTRHGVTSFEQVDMNKFIHPDPF